VVCSGRGLSSSAILFSATCPRVSCGCAGWLAQLRSSVKTRSFNAYFFVAVAWIPTCLCGGGLAFSNLMDPLTAAVDEPTSGHPP